MSEKECLQQLSEVLESEQGLRNCGGSESFYCQTVQSIVDYVPRKIGHLKECLLQKDYEGYIIEVHTLKSNAALIGALALSEEAKRLEYAGKEKKFHVIESDTETLVAHFEALITKLQQIMSSREEKKETKPKGFSSKEEAEQCHDILCEAADCIKGKQYETAMDVLELLDMYEMPEQLMDQVKQMQHDIQDGKDQTSYDEIQKILSSSFQTSSS